jgi:hypothetical protein
MSLALVGARRSGRSLTMADLGLPSPDSLLPLVDIASEPPVMVRGRR